MLVVDTPTSLEAFRSGLFASQVGSITFRKLHDVYRRQLFVFAMRIVNDSVLADEILQESFVSIWLQAHTFSASLGEPLTWMGTIVRNKAIDVLRKERRYCSYDDSGMGHDGWIDEIADTGLSPYELLAKREESDSIATSIKSLRRLQSSAIMLVYYDDLSHAEVSQQFDKPIGTIKTWVRRGLLQMKFRLERSRAKTCPLLLSRVMVDYPNEQ